MVFADAKDTIDVVTSETGDAQHCFSRRCIDVDGECLRMTARPLGLGVDLEIEEGIFGAGDFGGFEAIEADEPVRLVEAVFAHEWSCGEWKAGVCLGVGAEAGVVDALEAEAGVERVGALDDFTIGGLCGSYNHLCGLAGGSEPGRGADAAAIFIELGLAGVDLAHCGLDDRGLFLGRKLDEVMLGG